MRWLRITITTTKRLHLGGFNIIISFKDRVMQHREMCLCVLNQPPLSVGELSVKLLMLELRWYGRGEGGTGGDSSTENKHVSTIASKQFTKSSDDSIIMLYCEGKLSVTVLVNFRLPLWMVLQISRDHRIHNFAKNVMAVGRHLQTPTYFEWYFELRPKCLDRLILTTHYWFFDRVTSD